MVFPDGMYEVYTSYLGKMISGQASWFYSNKNGIGKYCLYLLCLLSIREFNNKNRLTLSFCYGAVICLATTIMVWSATSIVTNLMFVMLVVMAPMIKRIKPGFYNVYLFVIVLILAFVLFVVLQDSRFIAGFLENVLHKSLTFGGRMPIWSRVIDLIKQKPVLGYGYLSGVDARAFIGHRAASDAHNMFLTDLLYGGFCCLTAFLAALAISVRSIRKNQYSYEGIVLTAFVFCFFLMCLFENTSSSLYWVMITYGFYLRKHPWCQRQSNGKQEP